MQRCIKIECGVCQWNIEKPILYNNEIQHLSTFSTVMASCPSHHGITTSGCCSGGIAPGGDTCEIN